MFKKFKTRKNGVWVTFTLNKNVVTSIRHGGRGLRYVLNYGLEISPLAPKSSVERTVWERLHPQYKRSSPHELASSRSKNHEVILLPDLNYFFQESITGHVSKYSQIEHTFAPEALEVITNWILKQTK